MKRNEALAVLVAPVSNLTVFRYVVTFLGEKISPETIRQISEVFDKNQLHQTEFKELSLSDPYCCEFYISSNQKLDPLIFRNQFLRQNAAGEQETVVQAKLPSARPSVQEMKQRPETQTKLPHVLRAPNERKSEALASIFDFSVDIALQIDEPQRRNKKLVAFDMDSTLIQNEVIDELAREKNVYSEVALITQKAMLGEIDFDTALRQRCEKLKGLTIDDLEKVNARLTLSTGAEKLIRALHQLGCKTAVISGGFTFFTDRIKTKLGLHFSCANQLELQNQVLTGLVTPPIIHAQGKADFLNHLILQQKLQPNEVIAIGDGANDLLMLKTAGLGIAYHAKPIVQEKAHFSFNQNSMVSILYLLGFSRTEISQL